MLSEQPKRSRPNKLCRHWQDSSSALAAGADPWQREASPHSRPKPEHGA